MANVRPSGEQRSRWPPAGEPVHRLLYAALAEHTTGLIALSGCRRGEVPRLLEQGRWTEAEQAASRYREGFGEGSFFLEVQQDLVRGDAVRLRALAELGLSSEGLRVLEFAALLHDVGKIGVPDQILLKPDKLDDAEWAIMKQHSARSAQIVGQVSQLVEVANIVRHHHEWTNGLGYPDGLAGEAIPLLARIITLADAYEAMTSDRAYRPAFTSAKARDVIRENLGTQFDPHLGALFLSLEGLP
jgi:hypothetical protein